MASTDRATLARLGGLTRAATYDGTTVTARARSTFAASFLDGHECRSCPRIDIPADLPQAERERRAAALRKLHYTRIASLSRGRRAKSSEGPAAA